jgi:hypothetical protein
MIGGSEGDVAPDVSLEEQLAALRHVVAAQAEQLAEQAGQLAELRGTLGRPAPVSTPAPAVTPAPALAPADDRRSLSRRGVLLGGAGAAAATAGALALGASASPAAAANGDGLVVGSYNNSETEPTQLNYTNSTWRDLYFGFAVCDQGAPNGWADGTPAIAAYATGTAFGTAVQGKATGNRTGVYGSSDSGYGMYGSSNSWAGVVGASSTGPGGLFSSSHVNVALPADVSRAAPTSDSASHLLGDVVTDGAGNLWFCTTGGWPATWRKLTGPTAAGALHVLPSPVRVYDSRLGTSPAVGSKTPLAANTARVLDTSANASGVPHGALAVMCNLLVVNAAAGAGNLTLWANGVTKPLTNNMVWGGTAGRFSSFGVSAVDASALVQVESSVKTDFVLDIVGYYR